MLPIPFDLHLSTSRVCCAVLLAACLFDTFVFARPLEPRESTITDTVRIQASYDSNNMCGRLCVNATKVDGACTPHLSLSSELTRMESFHLGEMHFADKDDRSYTFNLLQQNLTDSKERNPWRSMDVAMKNLSSLYTHTDLNTPTLPKDTIKNWDQLLTDNTPSNGTLRMIIFRDGNKVDRKICVSMARGLEKNICTGYPTSKLSELALSNHLQIGLINFRDQADRRYILDHMRTRFKESGERENPWPPLDDFMRNFLSLRSYTESGMEIRTVPAKTMKMFEQHLVRGMRTSE
ncbi:hypothetical protein EV361DRAFT_147714 [Lentinula raphanica]|nr:hypothetical protein EV361DRAFT_147714 [Lentinula raphanica]